MRWAIAQGYRVDNPAGDAIAAALLTIIENHSYWICPVWWGAAAMIGVARWTGGAGLTRAKSGVWSAFVGICRPVPPVWGWGSGLGADVTL